jgi:hypothetical protein
MGSIGQKEEEIMQEVQPSFREWENLYRAAIHFWKIQPWQWVDDTDLFGVKNPEDGEIGYCCVTGALGEFLALVVYLGSEGLEGYLKIQSKESPDDEDMLGSGKCLVASFENRKALQKPDHDVLKRLGLEFRGSKSWPLFRSYEPGYYPWFLNQQQVRFLAHALWQTADVSLRTKNNRSLLASSEEGRFLVRVPEQIGPDLRWKDEWLLPAPLERAKYEVPVPDELRLERIKQKGLNKTGIWEIDFFHAPVPVQEENRPFFPLSLLVVDHDSGFVFAVHLASRDRHGIEFQKQMVDTIEETSLLPLEIWVKREEVSQLFEPIVFRLGLKMKKVKRLQQLEHAKKSMGSYFRSGKMQR